MIILKKGCINVPVAGRFCLPLKPSFPPIAAGLRFMMWSRKDASAGASTEAAGGCAWKSYAAAARDIWDMFLKTALPRQGFGIASTLPP